MPEQDIDPRLRFFGSLGFFFLFWLIIGLFSQISQEAGLAAYVSIIVIVCVLHWLSVRPKRKDS